VKGLRSYINNLAYVVASNERRALYSVNDHSRFDFLKENFNENFNELARIQGLFKRRFKSLN